MKHSNKKWLQSKEWSLKIYEKSEKEPLTANNRHSIKLYANIHREHGWFLSKYDEGYETVQDHFDLPWVTIFFFAIQNKISSILISIHEILWRVLLLLNFFPNNLYRLFLDVSSRIRAKKQVGSKYRSARNMKVFWKVNTIFHPANPIMFLILSQSHEKE